MFFLEFNELHIETLFNKNNYKSHSSISFFFFGFQNFLKIGKDFLEFKTKHFYLKLDLLHTKSSQF